MEKGKVLYEGKAKILYQTDDPDLLIQYFKDDATAFDGIKKGTIVGKGVANNKISCNLFDLLKQHGIDSHFVRKLSDNEMLVKNVSIIPVEVVVRNISTGSLCKRYGLDEGIVFKTPIVELYYKDDALHDPLMNDDHVMAMELATRAELAIMREQALKINKILQEFFDSIDINLVDFKLEFGRFKGHIILADEISPDTCRFWEKGTNRKLDKDRFRQDLGDVEKTYNEMMNRIVGKS
ncbi:MAG: phosphoribosylaminoimidazolesuccinocarboxamide synthase [Candidatus Marinimicrobia bacterium]|nr:phosphoribosylaminoimidazolesuccinocarboxamide synthase [Candidatus Neomarinimicrobiota bacterium]